MSYSKKLFSSWLKFYDEALKYVGLREPTKEERIALAREIYKDDDVGLTFAIFSIEGLNESDLDVYFLKAVDICAKHNLNYPIRC